MKTCDLLLSTVHRKGLSPDNSSQLIINFEKIFDCKSYKWTNIFFLSDMQPEVKECLALWKWPNKESLLVGGDNGSGGRGEAAVSIH